MSEPIEFLGSKVSPGTGKRRRLSTGSSASTSDQPVHSFSSPSSATSVRKPSTSLGKRTSVVRDQGVSELIDITPSERLLDFMLQNGMDLSFYGVVKNIFNPDWELDKVLKSCEKYIVEDFLEFETLAGPSVEVGTIEYVHVPIGSTGNEKAVFTRKCRAHSGERFHSTDIFCCTHSKNCKMMRKSAAFIVFILVKYPVKAEEQQLEGAKTASFCMLDDLVDERETEEVVDTDFEASIAENLDVAHFKAETIIEESQGDTNPQPDESSHHIVPSLPCIPFKDKEYILLSDIQKLFNLREDYCLAIIAEASDAANGIIDTENESKEEILKLDKETLDDKFIDAGEAFSLCFEKAKEAEKELSITDEDFDRIQSELVISNFGREESEYVKKLTNTNETASSINLWNPFKLEYDENQVLEIADTDNFLGHGKGSRAASNTTKDIALGHYLARIDPESFFVLHSSFSEDAAWPILCIKALTRLLGFSGLQYNAHKIMFLEKTAAIRIFGYGPGYSASRAGYFLAFSSYALAADRTNVKSIAGYKRKKFLRYRGKIPEEEENVRVLEN